MHCKSALAKCMLWLSISPQVLLFSILAMLHQCQLMLFPPDRLQCLSFYAESARQWKCCSFNSTVCGEKQITVKRTLLPLPDSWRGWGWTREHHTVLQVCTATLNLFPQNKHSIKTNCTHGSLHFLICLHAIEASLHQSACNALTEASTHVVV